MTQYVIRNPNNPIVRDLYKDIPLVDAQGNVVTDAQGRVVCDRYVVQGSVGISEQEVDNKISQQITNGLVDTTSTQTIGGNKSFSGTVTVTTPTKEVDGQTVTDTSDNTSKAANTKFVQAIKAELAEDISNIAEKSNAITVSDTVPNVSNMPIASGIIHPAQNIITENPDVSILALQQDMWAYDSTKTYVVGSYVFDENKDICKCIQGNGPTNIHAPSDSAYWLKLGGNALIPNQIIESPVPLTDANLHLIDGALLSGSGAYSEYVTMMGALHDADPTANIWTNENTWQTSVTNTGSCGKFVYDSVNNTLRLPKYDARYLKSTLSASDLGDLVNAQAPNVKGAFDLNTTTAVGLSVVNPATDNSYSELGAFGQNSSGKVGWSSQGSGSGGVHGINFDASRSSSVYSDSASTIDTDAVKVYYYIVLGTVSKTQIQIDIDNVMADLALKADKDFSNVTAPVQAFKDMSVGWGMPDYDSAIDISAQVGITSTSITIAQDSYLRIGCTNQTSQIRILVVDEVPFVGFIASTVNAAVGIAPIPKGTYQMRLSGTLNTNQFLEVIPCKGV